MTPTTPTTLPQGAPGASTSTGRVRPTRQRRPLVAVLFSVIAVGLVVAGGTLLQTQRADPHAATLDSLAVTDPRTYALQASANVTRLAELPPVSSDAVKTFSRAQETAIADLRQAIDDALAALDASLAQSALPEVPEDALAGDADALLPPARPFELPALPETDLGVGSIRLQSLDIATSPVGPRAGTPLDDALAQVEGLQAQLEDLLGGLPVGEVPVELPPGVGPLAPPAGPSQADQARDTVEPDEDGARNAGAHAAMALDGAASLYGSTQADLEELLGLYEALTTKVEDALEALEQAQREATRGVDAALQQRLVAVEAQVEALKAEADRLVLRHARSVADAGATLSQTIGQAHETHAAAVRAAQDAVELQASDLSAALQADARSRRDDIAAVVATASAELGEGAEARQALQAIQAAAAVADMQVDREMSSRLAALDAQVRVVQAEASEAQATLQALTAQALGKGNVTLALAVVPDADVQGRMHDVADAYGRLLADREAVLAARALSDLQDQVDQEAEDLLATALKATRAPQAVLANVPDIVDDAESTLVGEVGKDVDYVAKVGEDYGRVPTDERKARAAHWSSVAGTLEDHLQGVLLDGQALGALAQDVLAAAQQAEAELAAVA